MVTGSWFKFLESCASLQNRLMNDGMFEDNTHVFIVRVWFERREIPGAVPILRGVVEHLSQGEPRFFGDLEGLLEILRLWIDDPPKPSPEG